MKSKAALNSFFLWCWVIQLHCFGHLQSFLFALQLYTFFLCIIFCDFWLPLIPRTTFTSCSSNLSHFVSFTELAPAELSWILPPPRTSPPHFGQASLFPPCLLWGASWNLLLELALCPTLVINLMLLYLLSSIVTGVISRGFLLAPKPISLL